MKVFISWSGDKSHKAAMVFRDWLPSVIQSITPYVSSEDIDKGARWSVDIAGELEDSTFGLLCVTEENLDAPWLSFEAGALSKAMDKSFVTPFLLDIKRADVQGPILQFQSTIFEKNDIKKLVGTLNKACAENAIDLKMLDKAFEVWYPSLEEELSGILKNYPTGSEIGDSSQAQDDESQQLFIEEILELSRNNQKILRNTDAKLNDTFLEMKEMHLQNQQETEKRISMYNHRENPRIYVKLLNEILTGEMSELKLEYKFMLVLSIMESDFSWITVAGNQLLNVLNKNVSTEKKHEEILEFQRFVKMVMMNPYIWKSKYISEKSFMASRRYSEELMHMLFEMLEQFKINLHIGD